MKKRRIYQLFSKMSAKWDNFTGHDPQWFAWYTREVKCTKCLWPRPEWHANPTPIDLVLARPLRLRAVLAGVDAFPEMIRHDLLDVLRPYLKHVVLGTCKVRVPDGLAPVEYSTIHTPAPFQLEPHRGTNCRHDQCPGCGQIWNNVYWADGGILERSLDDRLVYQDNHGWLYVDSTLADELNLLERFPDLRFYKKFPVIKEPLDGDVLPGDPGWDGVFRPRAVAPFKDGEFGDAP